jgi:hypothetical protein
MWRLFYPLRYFRLRADGKAHLDLIPTVILAALMAGPFIAFGGVFFNPDGFLDKLINVTAALGGFYVAALVAAATFTHEDLDKVIKSGPIMLLERDMDGYKIAEYLTRRELACAIFGYLAFSSILVSFAAVFAVGMSRNSTFVPHLVAWGGETLYLSLRGITIASFTLVVAHIATVTGIGLYYLMDRLYRHDRAVITPKGGGRVDAA